MASQTVNFVNPTVITNLQGTTQSLSGAVSQLQTINGLGQTLSANVATNTLAALNKNIMAYVGNSGGFMYGGNAYSNQESFVTAGTMNQGGNQYSTTSIINHGSCSKIVTGLVLAKMIEEGIVNPFDTLYSIAAAAETFANTGYNTGSYTTNGTGYAYPLTPVAGVGTPYINKGGIGKNSLKNALSKTGYYWATCSVTDGASFPWSSTSYTGTVEPFMWSEVTLGDLIHMNLGLFDDIFCPPMVGGYYYDQDIKNYTVSEAAKLGATGGNYLINQYVTFANITRAFVGDYPQILIRPTDTWGAANATATVTGALGIFTSAILNQTSGAVSTPFLGKGQVGTYDFITKTIELNNSGVLPLMYRSGVQTDAAKPWNLRAVPATYDAAYQWISIFMELALSTYNPVLYPFGQAFRNYNQAKFFDPLGMTESWIANVSSSPAYTTNRSRYPDFTYRRAPTWGGIDQRSTNGDFSCPTGFLGFGCSSGYRDACLTSGDTAFNGSGPVKWFLDSYIHQAGATPTANPNFDLNMSYFQGLVQGSLNLSILGANGLGPFAPLGNGILWGTIGDFGKLLQFLCRKGCTANGTRLIKTETWNYFIAPKVGGFTILQTPIYPYPFTSNVQGNQSWCLGAQRINRDLTNEIAYGFDDTTLQWISFYNTAFYLDFYTGNWFVVGTNQMVPSSGLYQNSVGYGNPNNSMISFNQMSKMLISLIK